MSDSRNTTGRPHDRDRGIREPRDAQLRELLAEMCRPARNTVARAALEAAYIRPRLRSPASHDLIRGTTDVRRLRRDVRLELLEDHVRASLEDGLLRHSRRQALLELGQSLGFSEFHVHLVIAQCQFGPERVISPPAGGRGGEATRVAARLAAACVLGLAGLVGLMRWVHV